MKLEELENRIINADCLDILKQLPDKSIASYDMKRRFICTEKDKEYFEASCKRLEDHQRQGVLF